MTKNRVGLFGGTYNPIHYGHLQAAYTVQKRFLLDKVLFIPSYIPPHKESIMVASPSHRLQMVKLALSSSSQFIPSSIEIEAKGKSYSIYTLNKIKRVYPQSWIFFILGIDAFLEIHTWKNYQAVLQQCSFVVISRPDYDLTEAKHFLNGQYSKTMYWLSEEERIDENLLFSYNIFLFPVDTLDISSTEIRKRIHNGQSIQGLVPQPVEKYIKENRLYTNKNER